jgi:hypothetical protein
LRVCCLPESASPFAPLEIEHIIPKKHHGDDSLDNLALACYHCNSHKGANLTGIDPQSKRIEVLFHPRLCAWIDHFRWMGANIEGITAIGRTTVDVLRFNAPEVVELREALG